MRDMVKCTTSLSASSVCHCPGRREAKHLHRYHLTPVASYSSTMAEEIVALLRRLHSHSSWTPLINHHISESLQQLSHLVASPSELGVGAGTVGQKVSGWYCLMLLVELIYKSTLI